MLKGRTPSPVPANATAPAAAFAGRSLSDPRSQIPVPRVMSERIEAIFRDKECAIDGYWPVERDERHARMNAHLKAELQDTQRKLVEAINTNDALFALLQRVEGETEDLRLEDHYQDSLLLGIANVVLYCPHLLESALTALDRYYDRIGFRKLIRYLREQIAVPVDGEHVRIELERNYGPIKEGE